MEGIKNNICHIPVVAYMRIDENGRYYVDKERSVYADVPADDIARFIVDRVGMPWQQEG